MNLAWKVVGLFWAAAFVFSMVGYAIGHATFTNPYPWLPAAYITLAAATVALFAIQSGRWWRRARAARRARSGP